MTLAELKLKIAQALDVPVEELTDDSAPENVPTWDSIGAVQLLAILDEGYAGNIYEEKTEELVTVGRIIDFARRKGMISD
jgi:acyl carrier protein